MWMSIGVCRILILTHVYGLNWMTEARNVEESYTSTTTWNLLLMLVTSLVTHSLLMTPFSVCSQAVETFEVASGYKI